MDRFRNVLATIQRQLGALGTTQKLLIGSLAVIMLMTLFLVSQYAGKSALVELMPMASAEDQARAVQVLRSADLGVQDVAGRAMVPPGNVSRALATLNQSGALPSDTTLIFENIADKLSWVNPRETNRAIYKTMLQNELAAVLEAHAGVRAAKVFIDIPERSGIGQGAALPKAAITLFSDSGGPVDQGTVDGAARLVSGAVAGLDIGRVSVIDGSSNKPRRVTDDANTAPTAARDAATLVEKQFQEKIANIVRYIDGVVVEVTAEVDVRRVAAQETKYLKPNEGTVSVLKTEKSLSDTDTRASQSAEPGVRSNVGADINGRGSSAGDRTEKTESDTENEVKIGSRVAQITDPGGQPTRLVATVNVPRGYVLAALTAEKPEGAAPPGGATSTTPAAAATEAEIQARFDAEKKSIEEMVRPHLQTRTSEGLSVPGEVVVALVAGEGGIATGSGSPRPGASGGGGGVGTILAFGGGIIDKVVLGALALVAVGMMFLMVRKAGRKVDLPSAEQLVGLPPALSTRSDLVGEADESETPIEGIEVGEAEIKTSKMREQVGELVKKSPETAGAMLNRWVSDTD